MRSVGNAVAQSATVDRATCVTVATFIWIVDGLPLGGRRRTEPSLAKFAPKASNSKVGGERSGTVVHGERGRDVSDFYTGSGGICLLLVRGSFRCFRPSLDSGNNKQRRSIWYKRAVLASDEESRGERGACAKAACEQTDEARSEEVLRKASPSGTESPRDGYASLTGRGTKELFFLGDPGSSDRRELVRGSKMFSGLKIVYAPNAGKHDTEVGSNNEIRTKESWSIYATRNIRLPFGTEERPNGRPLLRWSKYATDYEEYFIITSGLRDRRTAEVGAIAAWSVNATELSR